MANQVVAGMEFRMSADAAKLLTELERVRKETTRMRKTVDRSANRIKYAFNSIRRAAQVIASAFIFTAGIKALGRLVSGTEKAADRIKLMEARFQQFARAGDAFTRVYNLSRELGVSLDTTADTMTRLLVATKSFGTAQSEIESITKNLVILGRAGGTSLEEMKGAMIQLSQGMASGRLQGEELRSVLENMPLVAMEIADEMGIGIGQIREAAAEGLIGIEVMVEALKDVGIKMEDLPKTWEMQTANLRTEWDLFLAELGNAVDSAGLLTALTDAVKWVRINMLGSFLGTSTDDLKKEVGEIAVILSDLEQRRQEALSAPGPSTAEVMGGQFATPYMAMLPGQQPQTYDIITLIEKYHERLQELNEELVRRAKLEKIAADNAAARDALRVDAKNQKRVEELQKMANSLRDSLKSDMDEFFELIDLLDELVAKTDLTAAQAEDIVRAKYEAIIEAARAATEEEKRLLDEVSEDQVEQAENVEAAWKQLGLTFSSAFEDAIAEGEKLSDVLKSLYKDLVKIWVRFAITQPFTEFMKKTFGGGQAAGGPVSAGTGYIVGEEGPEYFTPNRSGFIVPNHKLGMAGGAVVTYNIDARGADDSIFARLIPLLESTKEATENSIRHQMREGRFT